ncbi:hypothetical protein F2Q69_00002071 [Brassica cretica]|uniref:Uncharacterized protein n=1 Tax=Brassica cretica TaxID=69181 RepID=A0A8S9PHW4_BRACR|nr:hypothetical protein F2Q69_00002071 [Brassica cretica]
MWTQDAELAWDKVEEKVYTVEKRQEINLGSKKCENPIGVFLGRAEAVAEGSPPQARVGLSVVGLVNHGSSSSVTARSIVWWRLWWSFSPNNARCLCGCACMGVALFLMAAGHEIFHELFLQSQSFRTDHRALPNSTGFSSRFHRGFSFAASV